MSQPLEEALGRDRFAAANGIELLEVRAGFARARVVIDERHLNSIDTVHGGALFTLAAFAFFAACNAAGRLAMGITMSISCTKAVRSGTLEAEATEVARSRKLTTCTVRILDAEGDLVAQFQGTAYLKKEAFPPER